VSFSYRVRRAIAALGSSFLVVSVVPPALADGQRAHIDPAIFVAEGRTSVLVHTDEATLEAALAAARRAGMETGTTYDPIDVFIAYGDHDEIEALARDRAVSYIEANAPVELLTDTSHQATRGENVLAGEVTLPNGTVIDGSGVGVAVVDSGIDGTHPDLASRMGNNVKIVCSTPTGSIGSAATPFSECRGPKAAVSMDDTDTPSLGGHGTHVAGIVAGTGELSAGRFHGAAPGATLYGVSVGTFLTVENALDGLAWVLENHDQVSPPIKVVNNSWGSAHAEYDPENAVFHKATWLLQEALVADGVTVVAAAGNAGGGSGFEATTVGECINPTPGVVCVANYSDGNSGTREGGINGSSSRGRWFSPETWPDIAAPGSAIVATCREHLPVCGLLDESGGANPNYATLTGTSMAAPNVSGIIAQLYQADPSLTPAAVEDLLEDTAHKFAWGSEYGLFIDETNPQNSSSFEKGHGLVDVLTAVRVALGLEERPGPSSFPSSSPPLPTYTPEFPGFVAHWNFVSVTEQEFTTTCPPTISAGGESFSLLMTQGVDAHVFEIPEDLRALPLRARIGGSNPVQFFDVSATFYNESCDRTGGSAVGGDEDTVVPAGTKYILVTPGLLAYATFIYLELYDLSTGEQLPEATSLSLAVEGTGAGKTLRATLLDSSGNPLEGLSIDFSAEGEPIGSAVTDASGAATLTVPARYRASKTTFSASFAGNEAYSASSA